MKEPLSLEPLFPDRENGEPLGAQLTRRLREAISSGTLAGGTKMPGTRQFAKRLGLGRNTVALAFEQLIAEGYLEARTGSGTFVVPSGFAREHAQRASPGNARTTQANRRSSSLRGYFQASTGRGPLRPGSPDRSAFPLETWKRCARRALDVYSDDLGYAPASGLRALREAIASHVRHFRGISAHPDQIIVVEGAQAALHLATALLARSGEGIAVEDPCYALARAAFELAGLQLRCVPVDGEGLRTDRLPRGARLAFVTPTHQFPLGGTLALRRRRDLLEWADACDAYILEDDYDSEFTMRLRPLPALQSLDRHERVIYIGSFSKTLAPALRVGYLIAPAHLASAFRAARASTSLGVSLHLQATLAGFMNGGHFARHIRRMNAVYERRRSILREIIEPLSRRGFKLGPMEVGLHVAVIARQGFDDRELSSPDSEQRLVALSALCVKRTDCAGFLLGFTNGSDEDIARAAHSVVKTLRKSGYERHTCG